MVSKGMSTIRGLGRILLDAAGFAVLLIASMFLFDVNIAGEGGSAIQPTGVYRTISALWGHLF